MLPRWNALPEDVLSLIYGSLEVEDVLRLAQVSRLDAQRVSYVSLELVVIVSMLDQNINALMVQVHTVALPSLSRQIRMKHLTCDYIGMNQSQPDTMGGGSRASKDAKEIVRYNHMIQKNMERNLMIARQIGPTWLRPYRPILCLGRDKVVVGRGNDILVHHLQNDNLDRSIIRKSVASVVTIRIRTPQNPRALPSALDDLTGLLPVGPTRYIVTTVGGRIQQVRINEGYSSLQPEAITTALYQSVSEGAIESLSAPHGKRSADLFLTASRTGSISLYHTASPWASPSTINVTGRPWSSLLCLEGSHGYAAVGTSGLDCLQLYPIRETGFANSLAWSQSRPSALLGGARKKSAVYDIETSSEEMSYLTNNTSAMLLSAWYDGQARIHDLRLSGMGVLSGNEEHLPKRARPVLALADPWSQNSLYSCTFTGRGWVAAGSSRHGMVHFWDPRMVIEGRRGFLSAQSELPRSACRGGETRDTQDRLEWHKGGYSIFTPGRPESPVYSLQGEGARVWGVSDQRAFVVSFDGHSACRVKALVDPRRGARALRSFQTSERSEPEFIDPKDGATGYRMDMSLFQSA
jgi:WD40 repeat protein